MGDTTELKGRTVPGTKVFMAPERLRQGIMSFGADVYAFSMSTFQVNFTTGETVDIALILFSQIFTGEAPFQHLPEDDIRQVVVIECQRPERPEGREAVDRGLTDILWKLLERCWADNRKLRPKFPEITAIFESCYTGLSSSGQRKVVRPLPRKPFTLP